MSQSRSTALLLFLFSVVIWVAPVPAAVFKIDETIKEKDEVSVAESDTSNSHPENAESNRANSDALFTTEENSNEANSTPAKSVLSQPITRLPMSSAATAIQDRRRGVRADNSPISAAKVRAAVDKGIKFLQSEQTPNGSWRRIRYPGDGTALAVLALLNSGISPNDPNLLKGIAHLRDCDRTATYFVSLRIMALTAADPSGKIYLGDVKEDTEWLLMMQSKASGGWSYGQNMNRGASGDGSNSQFALLALHEASRYGIKIDRKNWQAAREYWRNSFRDTTGRGDTKTGVFAYVPRGGDQRGSMTCAGISSSIIIEENLTEPKDLAKGDRADCCRKSDELERVEMAFRWLAKNYTVRTNPHGAGRGQAATRLYYLYGLERAARLAGRRFIGANDWYRDGAKYLVGLQNPTTGYWKTTNGHGENNPIVGTAFALLFLSKGKRPVAIGKFDHGVRDWDLHPKGVHYLTRRLEKDWGNKKLNWQTVRAEGSTTDDLLEAPVLFMSGKDAIGLTKEQKANLKEYIENGGFLFAEACQGDGCGAKAEYDKAFRDLMVEIFPESKLQLLDRAHPIWNAVYPLLAVDVGKERPIYGLQACCRTSVVYCPANLSCYWALDQVSILDSDDVRDKLKKRIEYCAQLGVNVVSYATGRGRQLKDKGETPKLAAKKHKLLADRVLEFPKLNHGGGADEAPNAWRNMLQEADDLGLEMKLEKKMVSANTAELVDHPFIFMHGRQAFSFTEEEREAIKNHLQFGGFIFADSICASSEFTESFRREMKNILGEPLQPIARDHEIWMNGDFGRQIKKCTLRIKDPRAKGGFRTVVKPPEMEGFEVDGRLAIVFSPFDLSCAMENVAQSQCTGYTREDAQHISTNVILYSLLSDTKE
ncbi:MAG: DUF4159 domain-containing protein [Mariniblastus sp.]